MTNDAARTSWFDKLQANSIVTLDFDGHRTESRFIGMAHRDGRVVAEFDNAGFIWGAYRDEDGKFYTEAHGDRVKLIAFV